MGEVKINFGKNIKNDVEHDDENISKNNHNDGNKNRNVNEHQRFNNNNTSGVYTNDEYQNNEKTENNHIIKAYHKKEIFTTITYAPKINELI